VKRKRANKKRDTERSSSSTISETLSEMRNAKRGKFKKWRTKIKILTSFYQIVTQMEGVLGVRFPPIFEGFTRLMSRFANLSFLHVARVDCMVSINFYTTLASMTVAPMVCGSLIALIGFLFYRRAGTDQGKKKEVLNDTAAVLLTLSYLVFASVSTVIFETFNCRTFGDNPTRFLVSDQSVSCDTGDHTWWQAYAGFMMIVYPFGTPCLYGWLLWKDRELLKKEEEREIEENKVGLAGGGVGGHAKSHLPSQLYSYRLLFLHSTCFRAASSGTNMKPVSTGSTSSIALGAYYRLGFSFSSSTGGSLKLCLRF